MRRTTDEAGEQSDGATGRSGGICGGKGANQGEHQTNTHCAGPERERSVKGFVRCARVVKQGVAKERKKEQFTTLLHHVDLNLLRESFLGLKRKAAPGVDGVTWKQYEEGLENRLTDLKDRVHRGAYRAQPSRRIYIAKADGRQRPIGIAALEDKIVQQAVVTILNEIYEVDFRGFNVCLRKRV